MVAPAPAIPPNIETNALPIPCPTNSLFELCFVLVIESATSEVKRVSMVPNNARVTAKVIICLN